MLIKVIQHREHMLDIIFEYVEIILRNMQYNVDNCFLDIKNNVENNWKEIENEMAGI